MLRICVYTRYFTFFLSLATPVSRSRPVSRHTARRPGAATGARAAGSPRRAGPPAPRRAAARLAGHVAAAALFYAAALSGGSPAARGVRRPLVLGARCALARDAAACASRRRYLGKVAARNRLHKARRALGLARGATLDDAKRARKRVALEFHPDKNPSPDARDVFGRAEAAYELLAAEFKRERAAKGGGRPLGLRARKGVSASPLSGGSVFEWAGRAQVECEDNRAQKKLSASSSALENEQWRML